VPGWVPPVGTVADLTFNTVDQAAGRRTRFWEAWSGVAWAPWWGTYGSLIAAGGGHADGSEKDLYRIDVEGRAVTKIKNAAPVFRKSTGDRTGDVADGNGNGLVNPGATGWMWSDADPDSRAVQVGEPFTSHFYSYLTALPPDAIPGRSNALNGWLYTPGRGSLPTSGQRSVPQAHMLALGVGTLWELHGSGATTRPEHGGAAYDPQRKRVWYLRDGPSKTLYYRDLATGVQGSQKMCAPSSVAGYYKILEWSVAHGVLLIFGSSTTEVNVVDPAAGMIYTPAQSGPAPTINRDGAWAWSDAWNAIVYHAGDGSNTFHFLKPSGVNPRTSTWVWSSQTVSGTVYAGYTNPAYNRLRHATGLGNVLVWCARCELPVQMIHVQAP
jgi:hypothetical protein